jgi:transcriptional regulator with XRE-family HTH domain
MADMDKDSPKTPAPPGELLRALRQKNGWTLMDVSQRTGLTVSTLSKVEHGKMSLTYDKMMRIATGLGIDIGVLFAAPTSTVEDSRTRTRPSGGRRSITRRGEGRLIESRNFIQQYPAAELLQKQLVPIIVEVKARSRAEFGQLLGHPGEEYVMVIEGKLELHTEFYEPVLLEQGDSIYFDSSMAHGYVAAGSERCVMLSVCSTAEWGGQAAERSAGSHAQVPLEPQIIRAN